MLRNFLVLLTITFLWACNSQKNFPLPEKQAIFGLASPIQLTNDITTIYLTDYIPNLQVIDSIIVPKYLDLLKYGNTGKIAVKLLDDSIPWLLTLDIYVHGTKYSIPIRKSRKLKYTFSFDPKGKKYNSVYIRGEMNAWNPTATPLTYVLEDSTWKTRLLLEPGYYQYLLVLDGKDCLDPNNQDSVSNGIGGFNSVLKVGEPEKNIVPYLYTVDYDKKSILIASDKPFTQIQVFYQNFLLPDNMIHIAGSKVKIQIPKQAKTQKRTFVRVFAANKYGISNDLLIPLNYGLPLDKVEDITRNDYHASVMYNVFVDRFYNGDTTNDAPIRDGSVLPKANFMGGDIKGIIHVLKQGYFDTLGINMLWLSPVMPNVQGAYGFWENPKTKFSAYHGYWPINFTGVDKRFGTEEDLKELVNLLHNQGKNIIIDFVAHHVHEKSWFYQKYPKWTTNLYLPDGSLNTEKWDTHRLTTWFDVFLPTIDNSRPQVYNMVTDSALWWIKTFNLDGFRHDAAKHVPLIFWRTLTRKLKLEVEIPLNRKIYQIGETYGSPELIASYLGSGLLDAQFDFNVYDALITALAGDNNFKNLKQVLSNSFKYYGWHNLMGYISGNQDRARFISYASGSLRFDEDAKKAGWTRNIEIEDTLGYYRMAELMAFITTIPGIPVIYYGDEIGMPGGNDPDNRRMMIFSGLDKYQKWLKSKTAELIHFRRHSLPLIYGDFQWLYVDEDVMVYARTYFDKIVIVALNRSLEKKKVVFDLPINIVKQKFYKKLGEGFVKIENSKMTINILPVNYLILNN